MWKATRTWGSKEKRMFMQNSMESINVYTYTKLYNILYTIFYNYKCNLKWIQD